MKSAHKCQECGQAKTRGRPHIAARFSREEVSALEIAALRAGKTKSDLLREAVAIAYPDLVQHAGQHATPHNRLAQPHRATPMTNPAADLKALRKADLTVPVSAKAPEPNPATLND